MKEWAATRDFFFRSNILICIEVNYQKQKSCAIEGEWTFNDLTCGSLERVTHRQEISNIDYILSEIFLNFEKQDNKIQKPPQDWTFWRKELFIYLSNFFIFQYGLVYPNEAKQLTLCNK